LCVISIDDVPSAIFSNYVHDMTIGFQHPLYFVHPRDMLKRAIAKPRDSLCVSPIVSLGRGPVKALGYWQVSGKPRKLLCQGFTIILRGFIRIP
jgi:hypothetical protein